MDLDIDTERIEEVSARLDLRLPNREALESLVAELALHYDIDHKEPPFECVVKSATGVGKTYILAAGIEYLVAAKGVRNFAVVAPGRTIRDKTVANFTAGNRKSLLGAMQSDPLVVTADNFDTPAVRAVIDDDSKVKVYVFSVQALLQPTTRQGRRTHSFQEGLGAGLYQHLSDLEDLVVFADEHHCYYGPAFSQAVRGLEPYAIIGLTATPDAKTPEDQIVYRYPLAAAIADKWVKTPVIVGRRDDRADPTTKLADGLALLRYKEEALDSYCAENGVEPIHPVMLVTAGSTADADAYAELLGSSEFDDGRWEKTILVVHSTMTGDKKEQALADLEAVEDSDSSVRIIISVGMLKEGWDVSNVYVIVSMRASISNVLTEQTLGRGLRLPFGAYTGIELLDTVEVVAHERYSDLLRRAEVLNEAFIDRYTRAELRRNSAGQVEVTRHSGETVTPIILGPDDGSEAVPTEEPGTPVIVPIEERTKQASEETADLEMERQYEPRTDVGSIKVPILKMTKVEAHFSLADITDFDQFTKLGQQLAANPSEEFQRTRVGARVVVGRDGLRRTVLVTGTAEDHLNASITLFPLDTLITGLTDALLSSPIVQARASQARAAAPIIDAFVSGLGADAKRLLSAYSERAAKRLVDLVVKEHRKYLTDPRMEEVVEIRQIGGARTSKRTVELNRTGKFVKNVPYNSWTRCLYNVDWFDSEPERAVAAMADDSGDVRCWVRLHRGELPILWRSDGREYNADLIVVETDGSSWVVEIKSDDAMGTYEVQAKRQAAKRWVNHVNADGKVDSTWGYILVAEQDIKQATHSWAALKKVGS